MENPIVYAEVEEDFLAAMGRKKSEQINVPGVIQTGIKQLAYSTGSLSKRTKTEVINKEFDLIELDSDSDIEEDFHAVVESIKYEDTEVRTKEVETARIAPPILQRIPEIPNAQVEKSSSLICRLCAIRSSDLIYIFGVTVLHKCIAEKIEQCLPITVKRTDSLSQNVCHKCLQKLESCYRFYRSVTDAEMRQRVSYEKALASLKKKKRNPRTVRRNGQGTAKKKANDERKSDRNCLADTNHGESIDSSDLGGEKKDGSSSCVVQNRELPVISLESDRTSASRIKQGMCNSAQNGSMRDAVHAEPNSQKDYVSDEVNYTPSTIGGESDSQIGSNLLPNEISCYFMRQREPRKFSKIIKCHLCGDVFPTIQKCRIHARIHSSINYYPCCYCDKVIATEKEWGEHWSQHHVNKGSRESRKEKQTHDCDECGRNFLTKEKLESHKLDHGSSKYQCKKCEEVLYSATSLHRHIAAVHNEQETFPDDRFSIKARNKKIQNARRKYNAFQCACCKRKYATVVTLQKHKEFCFGNRKMYTCDYCNKVFNGRSGIRSHIQIHTRERPYGCKICSERFMTAYSRDNHYKLHTDERPFECSICKMTYLSRQALYAHKKNIHSRMSYPCLAIDAQCRRWFRNATSRDLHVATHTSEKPYKCHLCKVEFKWPSALCKHKISCREKSG